MIAVRARARRLIGRRLKRRMPGVDIDRVHYRFGAVLAIALLAGCAHERAITTPSVCPAAPGAPPAASAVLPEALPDLDENLTDPAAIGSAVLRVRVDSAALYQSCLTNRAALLDWIKAHSKE